MIYKVYKDPGKTSLQAMREFAQANNLQGKLTFAGRLDPLAEGVFLVLSGQDRFKKDKLNALDKKYTVEVLFGVSTDTGDILGMPQSFNLPSRLGEAQIKTLLKGFVGDVNWSYPCFSSKTFKGMELFKWALQGKCPKERPKYSGKIYRLKFVELKKLSITQVQEFILSNLNKVEESSVKDWFKDFRVSQIQNAWMGLLDNETEKSFFVLRLEIVVSKSVYMRTLAEKIGEKLNLPALALSIKRDAFGKFIGFGGVRGVFLRRY